MNKKGDFNWGGLVGFLIGVMIILIIVSLFRLTWGFWSNILEGSGMFGL
jgi:hypothetical protein